MINFKQKHYSYIFWALVVVSILLLLAVSVFIFYSWVRTLQPSDVYNNNFVRNQIKQKVGEKNEFLVELAPQFLGFKEPKTYLILFLNNTELRPGGGFIGSYATVRLKEGKIEILQLEGAGKLDQRSPKDWKPKPPPQIKEYLKVDQWYFRDSNWSPDFKKSSKRTLKFYNKEGGIAGKDIDHVVGITTNVLSSLLKVTGPVTVENHTFTHDDVIRKLQYEVHYGFKDRGLSFSNRKQIMQPFFHKLVKKIQEDLINNYKDYLDLVRTLFVEKHIIVYSEDKEVQKKMEQRDYAGRVNTRHNGDFLMWVDANLAALKTDHAIRRDISYEIKHTKEYGYVGLATMEYSHTGKFDWRTAQYRSFARVYVPRKAEFISASKNNKKINPKNISIGSELNKKWFGYVTKVQPGGKKTVTYRYDLPTEVSGMIKEGKYQLQTQKQIGTNQPQLTLDLDFDKKISDAKPAENESNWGNDVYTYKTKLNTDKQFRVNF